MELGDLLEETLNVDCDEVWENERTPTPVRCFAVRLHSMGFRCELSGQLNYTDRDHIEKGSRP